MGNGNNNGNNGKTQPLKKVRIDDLLTFSPITDNQRKTYEAYRENQHLLLHGIAGTDKTFLSFRRTISNCPCHVFFENFVVNKGIKRLINEK